MKSSESHIKLSQLTDYQIMSGVQEGKILEIDNTSVVIPAAKNKILFPSSEWLVNHVKVLDSEV